MKMRRALAFFTAFAMLSTVALGTSQYNPVADLYNLEYIGTGEYVAAGNSVTLTRDSFANSDGGYLVEGSGSYGADTGSGSYEFSDDYFTISRQTYNRGGELVSGIYFGKDAGGEQAVVVEFKMDKTLTNVTTPNFRFSQLRVKAKSDSDVYPPETDYGFARNAEFTYTGEFSITVAAKLADVYSGSLSNGCVNLVKSSPYSDFYLNEYFVNIYGRGYSGDEIYANITNDFSVDILRAYPDSDEMSFYQVGFDGASVNWNIEIFANSTDYIYEVSSGTALKNSSLQWNSSVGAFTGPINSSVNYVVTNTQLPVYGTATAPSVSTGTTNSGTTTNNNTTTDTTTGTSNNDTVANAGNNYNPSTGRVQ